jgi:predicted lipid-binding transport protein (Tim44 family)
MKKLFILTFLFAFAFNAIGFAAVSSSKPKMSSPAPKAPSTQQAAPSTDSGYKPSAPSSSYSEKAPAAAAKSAQPNVQQPSSGGFMRNIALLGGGMMLGSMLGNMFGFGNSGMFAEIIGLLFNVMLFVGVFMAGRFLWDKYKKSQEENKYKR